MEVEQLPYTTRSDARQYECPECGAGVGEKCVGGRAQPRESVHRERLNSAARQLGHNEIVTLRVEENRLLDANGDVVGHVVGFDMDVQLADVGALGGNLRRGEGEGKDVDVPSVLKSKEELSQGGAGGQLFDVPDVVEQVFDFYKTTVPGKQNSRLTAQTRRIIKKALEERPVEQIKRAIVGLAASQYHTDNGYTGIDFAIGKRRVSEVVGDRIDMMAAKAPETLNALLTTMDEVLRTVPSEKHGMVREMVVRVNRMYSHPDDGGMRQLGEDALTRLRQLKLEPEVIERDGKRGVGGWRRVVGV